MPSVLAGYDGSPSAAMAIDVAARFLPEAEATIAYVWAPPFADTEVRDRLVRRAGSLDELISLVEQEGAVEAERIAAHGAALASAAGWRAEPVVRRGYGGVGYELARLAEEARPGVVVVGSRGLGGVRAVLGSTSDLLAHVSTVPVLVVPRHLLSDELDAAASGPVLVAYDGSGGSRTALDAAASLLPGRSFVVATVGAAGAEAAERETLELAGLEGAETAVLEDGGGSRGAADLLVGCAAERAAGLIVVGSRGRSAAREILLGSVAKGVLHRAQRPVLVVPGERFD